MMQLLPDLFPLSLTCGTVILLLLMLTPVLSRRFTPRWRYWAWLFVSVRLLLPFSLSWHPVELSTPASLTAPSYDPQMSREVKQASPYGWQCGTAGGTTYQVWYTDDQLTEHRIVDLMLVRLEGVDGAWSASFRWNYIWAVGGTVSLALLVLGYLRLCRQMARRRQPPSRAAQEELERQRRLLSVTGRVRLFQVPGLASPLLMGFLHPTVLLPHDLPSAALSVALAHELQHLKRRDLWYKLLLSLAGCVHWFNPLVWLMVRKGGQDVELCCDYDLLKARDMAGRRAYGQAILDQMTAGDKNLSRLTTGFSGDKKEVFARFKAMMDTAPKHRGRAALAAALAVVVLAGGLVGCQNGASTPEGRTVTLAEGIEVPQAVADYAREYVEEQLAFYTEKEGYEITQAEIVGLTLINTGSAAENSGVSMYLLEHRLKAAHPEEVVLAGGMTMEDGAITEWGSAGQPYLLLYWEDSGEETTWEPIQVTHTLPIQEDYDTPKMLEKYGNAYTAAAMELYRSWRNAKKGPEPFSADMLSQGVYDALAQEWETYDQLSEEERLLSSHIPGSCYGDFEDWASCEEFLGLSILNPLEDSGWLEKGTYVGMPEGFRDAPGVRASWYGTQNGHVEWLSVQSGYRSGDLRITLDAMLYGDSSIGKPTDSGWSVELERQSYLANQTGDTPLIVKEEGEQYVSLTAHFVQGYALYRLDVIGTPDVQEELQETLERALEYFT